MKIDLLADHPDVLDTLADWYVREWEPYYGADGPGDARADLNARCNRHSIPIGLVAVDDNAVRGVVALDLDAATGLTPSVVGLLVAAGYRGRGIAARLLNAAARQAAECGFNRIYTSTSVLGNHLSRNGWRRFGDAKFLNDEQGSIYVRDVANTTL